MQGYRLNEGLYKTDLLTDDDMWKSFNWLFSTHSKNDTSYKFIFLKAIIDCIDKKDVNGKISFDILFEDYTRLSWNLILKYGLLQKAVARDGRRSTLENTLYNRCSEYKRFEELFEEEKKRVCHEVKMQCKKYVVGALYGDTDGFIYSFSKKEEWIKLNPLMEDFIRKNRVIIENLNYFKWADFYKSINDDKRVSDLSDEVKLTVARKDENIYRTILAYEFESTNNQYSFSHNTLELLWNSKEVSEESTVIDEYSVENEFYKDMEHMRKYMDDPVLLLSEIKKKKRMNI